MPSIFEEKLKYLKLQDVRIQDSGSILEKFLARVFGKGGAKYSKRSPFGMVMTALFDIKNLLFLHLERAINENNARVATSPESLRALASLNSYEALRPIPARGSVTCKVDPSITDSAGVSTLYVKNGAHIKTKVGGLDFFADFEEDLMQINVPLHHKFKLNITQGVRKNQIYVMDGAPLEIIQLGDTDGTIANGDLEVRIDGSLYKEFGLLRDMGPSDKGYITRNGKDGGVRIIFGNGANGKAVRRGATASIGYVICNGSDGNIPDGADLVFATGVSDRENKDDDAKDYIGIKTDHAFISGYDGDGMDVMRMNIGKQSSSNVIANKDQLKSYLRRYPSYFVARVGAEPGENSITALLMPNINKKTHKNYFGLSAMDFIIPEGELALVQKTIEAEKQYAITSFVKFLTYKIECFAIMALIKFNTLPDDTKTFKVLANSLISNILIKEYHDAPEQISRTSISAGMSVKFPFIESLDIIFKGDDSYIDNLGDIDTIKSDPMAIPIIQSGTYDGAVFEEPVKYMVEVGDNEWAEMD